MGKLKWVKDTSAGRMVQGQRTENGAYRVWKQGQGPRTDPGPEWAAQWQDVTPWLGSNYENVREAKEACELHAEQRATTENVAMIAKAMKRSAVTVGPIGHHRLAVARESRPTHDNPLPLAKTLRKAAMMLGASVGTRLERDVMSAALLKAAINIEEAAAESAAELEAYEETPKARTVKENNAKWRDRCANCGDKFKRTGPAARSMSASHLCVDCYILGAGE